MVCRLRYTASGAHPACTRRAFRSTSSVQSYLRSNLTADSRTSPVPAISHFYFHFYYFIILMFERFMICIVSFYNMCRLRHTPSFTIHSVVYDTLRPAPNLSNICIIFYFFTPHLAFIPAPIPAFVFCLSCVFPVYFLCISSVYPVYVRRAPDVHSFLHLRSNLTFGRILPRILEQVLCPRYSTFLSTFITFIYGCSRDL